MLYELENHVRESRVDLRLQMTIMLLRKSFLILLLQIKHYTLCFRQPFTHIQTLGNQLEQNQLIS